MTLEKLFKGTDWTQTRLAEAVGQSASHICKLASGKCDASLGLALGIEHATGGLVRAREVPMSDRSRQTLAALRRGPRDKAGAAA